jgi:guanylate kinase
MLRFHALQAHISKMPDEGLRVIMDQRVVGTLTLLSQFFDPSDSESIPSPSTRSLETGIQGDKDTDGKIEIEEEKGVRVKMNKWCWIFLGAWTVGEAGRVLEHRKSQSQIST